MRKALSACVALLATTAGAADDFRVMKLEQEMRTLERQVRSLQHQVSALERQLRRAGLEVDPSVDREPSVTDMEAPWLSSRAWKRVRSGMDELEVIETLGKPVASRRDAQGRRILLYTLEIGSTGFLTGSVAFEDGRVVEVHEPRLR